MNRYSKYALFIVGYCVLACGLTADSIPTFTATSASAGVGGGCGGSFGCLFGFSATSNSFTLSGSGFSDSSFRYPLIPFLGFNQTSFAVSTDELAGQQIKTGAFGMVTLAGVTYYVDYTGSGTINAPEVNIEPVGGNDLTATSFTVTSGNIVAPTITPASPSTIIVLPATMQASFGACLRTFSEQCGSSPLVANVSIDLTGELMYTISVFYEEGTNPVFADISESFASTPVPEPRSIILVVLGVALAAYLSRTGRSAGGSAT